jgi:hypothetical protein
MNDSALESLLRAKPGLGTILAEGLWIAIALAALFERRQVSGPDSNDHDILTTVAVFASTVALAIVSKDWVVRPRWILPLNIVAAALALMFFFGMTAHQPTLGPTIAPY